jgi:hypothetical protein
MLAENPDHRTREYKDLVKVTPPIEELLGEEIDGELFLYEGSQTCKICTSDQDLKSLVDTLLLFPKSYADVLRSIEPMQNSLGLTGRNRINYENIRNHQKKHLPFDKMAVRDIVERRAGGGGKKILSSDGHLLTPEAFYEVVVIKGFEDVVSGVTRPTLTQTMLAMDMLKKLDEKTDNQYKPEVLVNQLNTIIMAIREVLPAEWREKLFDKISQLSDEADRVPSPKELAEAQDYVDEDLLYEE